MIVKRLVILLLLLHGFTLNIPLCAYDYTSLFEIRWEQGTYCPRSEEELQKLVQEIAKYNKKICVTGTGKSQGGQNASDTSACQINMKNLDKLLYLDTQKKEVTVQTGMSWRKLQELIAPHGLAVKAMQSYNDFSIGGSLAANVHGQDLRNNPLIQTVISFKLLVPTGEIIPVSRSENSHFFNLALGGYGLLGIITEVTLSITEDILMKRVIKVIDAKDLADYFATYIKNNPAIQFYSTRYFIGSSHLLEKALVITYEKIELKAAPLFNFAPTSYKAKLSNKTLSKLGTLLKRSDLLKEIRFALEKCYLEKNKIVSRNNLMSFSIDGLPSNDKNSSYILQEYFIPYAQLNHFIEHLKQVIKSYSINILNVTARHVHQDKESMLAYAPQDRCALVLYLHVPKSSAYYASTVEWTRKLIDKALALQGSYYLPYQLIATPEQLSQAYPQFGDFIALKKQYDPKELFTNRLYEKYKELGRAY